MTTAKRKPFYRSLYIQVLLAIAAGISLGYFFPDLAIQLQPFGEGFIRLIKMMIAPLIFCTIVLGMAGSGSAGKMGRIGLKSLIYFEVMSTIALVVGLLVINVLKPGVGMNVDVAQLDASSIEQYKTPHQSGSSFLLDIIPHTLVDAFARGNLLQVLLISLLFGFAASRLREKAQPVISFIRSFSHILFEIIHLIMKLAPIGALGAMAYTIGKYGTGSLTSLAQLMGSFYLTCLIFIIIFLGGLLWLLRINIFKLLRYIREELLIVLGTSSSEAALPGLMEKMEKAGCSPRVVGLVIPSGYSFNLDGTAIYLSMAAVFIAQATNTPLDFEHQLSMLMILLITSKGAAGVTGSGFITLAATLQAHSVIPVAGLALILGIDRFMSEARALTNLIGNATASLVIARWEGELDSSQHRNLFRL
jgi:aerobic C4-dicarboxylate transport protein